MNKYNKTHINLDKFDAFMKDLNRTINIKVGILPEEGTQKHADSNLTNADLGAIHEFGVAHKNIPTRSFLRASLLSDEGKNELNKVVSSQMGDYMAKELSNDTANSILDKTAKLLAETALKRIQRAFETNGYGEWEPTSETSKQKRKTNKSAPTLVDSGELKKCMSYSINGKQWGKPPYENIE